GSWCSRCRTRSAPSPPGSRPSRRRRAPPRWRRRGATPRISSSAQVTSSRPELVPGADAEAEVLVALGDVEERAEAPHLIREEAEDAPRKEPDVGAEREMLPDGAVDEARRLEVDPCTRLQQIRNRFALHRHPRRDLHPRADDLAVLVDEPFER